MAGHTHTHTHAHTQPHTHTHPPTHPSSLFRGPASEGLGARDAKASQAQQLCSAPGSSQALMKTMKKSAPASRKVMPAPIYLLQIIAEILIQ